MSEQQNNQEKKNKRRGGIIAFFYAVTVIAMLFLIAFKGVQDEFFEIEMGMEANQGVAESGGMIESGSESPTEEQPASSSESSAPSADEPVYTEESDVDMTAPDEEAVRSESDNTGESSTDNSSTPNESPSEEESPTVNIGALFNKDKVKDGPPSDDDGQPNVLDGGGPNPGDGDLDGIKGFGDNPLGNGDGISKYIPTNNTDYRGKIYVEVTVDKAGNVTGAKVKGNLSDPGWTALETEVIAAAKKWKFPAISNNTNLQRKGEIIFNFEKQ
jgi:TonB family protein